jgi:predicted transcriptional regulator of viral defense system
MARHRGSVDRFIADLAASGCHHFTTADLLSALGGSLAGAHASLRRLRARGEIATPVRSFHLIVPPEYRGLGCLPAEQFVPLLLEHLGEYGYASLLSAAELHGAAHHRPQAFQVMTMRNRRGIECGLVRVEFIARHDLASTPTILRNTPRGPLRIASAEATALELVGYADRCGGLDTVVEVLAELVESIDPMRLAVAAEAAPLAWAQRLGHLLEVAGQHAAAAPLAALIARRDPPYALLARSSPTAGHPHLPRWRLVANATVEAPE